MISLSASRFPYCISISRKPGFWSFSTLVLEAYSEPCQASKMKLSAKIINDWKHRKTVYLRCLTGFRTRHSNVTDFFIVLQLGINRLKCNTILKFFHFTNRGAFWNLPSKMASKIGRFANHLSCLTEFWKNLWLDSVSKVLHRILQAFRTFFIALWSDVQTFVHNIYYYLTYSMALVSFCTPSKNKKPRSYLMLSGGTEKDQRHEIG